MILRDIQIFKKISTASLYSALYDLGYKNCWMKGIKPITINKIRVVGIAKTLKYLPLNNTLRNGIYNEKLPLQAIDEATEKNIIVCDAGGIKVGVFGGCMCLAMKVKGIKALIIDGGVRDVPEIKSYNFPVFAKCATPASIDGYIAPVSIDIPVRCGGVLVRPEDIIVGDDDGVVVIPKEEMEEVMKKGLKYERLDEESRKRILTGYPIKEAYPPREEWIS
jgi:regulator of RNase E activity RraA